MKISRYLHQISQKLGVKCAKKIIKIVSFRSNFPRNSFSEEFSDFKRSLIFNGHDSFAPLLSLIRCMLPECSSVLQTVLMLVCQYTPILVVNMWRFCVLLLH